MVVPIYGVEKYIHKFLTSLTPNLCPKVEVILVDDGSIDNCGAIIDEYADLHSDVVSVIHKPNGGVSSARNAGLEKATGEYILFPDPDDYLDEKFSATILEAIEKYKQPDVVLFDYHDVLPNGKMKLKNIPMFKQGPVDRKVFLHEFAKDEHIMSTVWCKAIKRKFYEGLRFDTNIKVAEDALLLTDLMLKVENFVYIPQALYFYCVRMDSLTKSMDTEDAKKCFNIAMYRYEKYNDLFGDISIRMPVKFAYGVMQRAYIKEVAIDTKIYEDFIKKNISEILFSSEFSLNTKKQCLLVYFDLARKYYAWKYKK